MSLNDLPTPALLLDLDILERNLASMQDRADRFGVALRPHIKTHKCLSVARRQIDLGARGLTVSTFYEADQFARAGFDDLTWALPFPPIYTGPAIDLARRATVRFVVDSPEAAAALAAAGRAAGIHPHVWIKVDCGYHRAGVDPRSDAALTLARRILDSPLEFDGILTHAGHSYAGMSPSEISTIAEQERAVAAEFAERLRDQGIPVANVSVGSTPTTRLAKRMDGVTEIRPGNYAFFDLTQTQLGVCCVEDCAVTVLCSIISHQAGSEIVITDAGALALSKDSGATHLGRSSGMGLIYKDYTQKILFSEQEVQIQTLSQEHGKLLVHSDRPFHVGERLRILENHSCLTAALFDRYHVVRGDTVLDAWQILRGRM